MGLSRANRAIGRSAIARGARCAPRARAGPIRVARALVTLDEHGASRAGSARALARRPIQARETYRGHDESTALGGLAHLHSLEVGSAAGAGAGGGGPRDDARGHRGGNNSGHFYWCAAGMCCGACGYAGVRARPAFRVSRSETNATGLSEPHRICQRGVRASQKGKRFSTGSGSRSVRDSRSWAPKLSLDTIRCEISRLLDRRGTSDRNGPCEAGARVSATRQRFANRRISAAATTSRVAGFFLEEETESHKSK